MKFIATGDPACGTADAQVIREALESLVQQRAEEDPKPFYLDRRPLYVAVDAEKHPLHPNSATRRLIGERFAKCAFAGEEALGEIGYSAQSLRVLVS